MAHVDLRQLAIDREAPRKPRARVGRHLVTRYLLPGALIAGFLSLATWSAWDILFPPRLVTVVPVRETTAAVQRGGTALFKAAGWVEPRPTPVRVAALAPGVIEKLLVVEDQLVKQGEPVAELVKADAQLARERSIADLKLREAEVAEMTAAMTAARTRFEQPVHLQAALKESEAALAKIDTDLTNLPFEVRRAEARRDFTQKDYDGKVASGGAIAGRVVAEAKSELDAAVALVEGLNKRNVSLTREKAALTERRDALKKQLELLADEIKARDESQARLNAAQARSELARVALAEADLRLQRMTIRAPVDARVYQLVGKPGTTLTGGMGQFESYDGSTVVTLYRPDMLQVRVDVRFENVPQVSLGQSVEIQNPALTEPLVGKVLFISSLVNIQKNTLEVKVALDGAPVVFRPEMLVEATFLAPEVPASDDKQTEELVPSVPRQLVQDDPAGGKYVWVADLSERRAPRAGEDGRCECGRANRDYPGVEHYQPRDHRRRRGPRGRRSHSHYGGGVLGCRQPGPRGRSPLTRRRTVSQGGFSEGRS